MAFQMLQNSWSKCMSSNTIPTNYVDIPPDVRTPRVEAHDSGVSWGAVIGGAFVIAALYLILLALGAGFGLSAVSPWANAGMSATTAGLAGMIWLIVTEIVAATLGGYLTGRLRTKWAMVHTDE